MIEGGNFPPCVDVRSILYWSLNFLICSYCTYAEYNSSIAISQEPTNANSYVLDINAGTALLFHGDVRLPYSKAVVIRVSLTNHFLTQDLNCSTGILFGSSLILNRKNSVYSKNIKDHTESVVLRNKGASEMFNIIRGIAQPKYEIGLNSQIVLKTKLKGKLAFRLTWGPRISLIYGKRVKEYSGMDLLMRDFHPKHIIRKNGATSPHRFLYDDYLDHTVSQRIPEGKKAESIGMLLTTQDNVDDTVPIYVNGTGTNKIKNIIDSKVLYKNIQRDLSAIRDEMSIVREADYYQLQGGVIANLGLAFLSTNNLELGIKLSYIVDGTMYYTSYDRPVVLNKDGHIWKMGNINQYIGPKISLRLKNEIDVLEDGSVKIEEDIKADRLTVSKDGISNSAIMFNSHEDVNKAFANGSIQLFKDDINDKDNEFISEQYIRKFKELIGSQNILEEQFKHLPSGLNVRHVVALTVGIGFII